jgi:selenocysteine lyase/cysteine desulfurase
MDLKRLREDTLGTKYHIHFNNAGSSLLTRQVKQAMTEYLDQEEMHGGYETAERYLKELIEVYPLVAQLLNGKKENIALLENATIAWNTAFWSIPFQKNDVILTTYQEYASNYINYLMAVERYGVKIELIPETESGEVDLGALSHHLHKKVKLVSITHMPTNGGLVQPVEEIGQLVKNTEAFYLIDACQSVGHFPVDVQKLNCDFLSATGRKYLRAPRGTGFLYASNRALEATHPFYLDLHSATWTSPEAYLMQKSAKRYETWENSLANRMGLKEAVRYVLDLGLENIWRRILGLASILRNKLEEIKEVQVHDIGNVSSGIVTFTMANQKAEDVKRYLAAQNINVSVTGYENTLLDMQKRHLTDLVRASVHYYNTEEEIEKCCNLLAQMK